MTGFPTMYRVLADQFRRGDDGLGLAQLQAADGEAVTAAQAARDAAWAAQEIAPSPLADGVARRAANAAADALILSRAAALSLYTPAAADAADASCYAAGISSLVLDESRRGGSGAYMVAAAAALAAADAAYEAADAARRRAEELAT